MPSIGIRNVSLKEYLFPIFCLGCQKEGVWVCESCFLSVGTAGVYACPFCHLWNSRGECCKGCRGQSALTSLASVTPYTEGTIAAQMIRVLKYDYAEDILPLFARMFSLFFEHRPGLFQDIDMIVPVPLHPRRLAERGFNQAERFADMIARILDVPVVRALQRARATHAQARLTKEQRANNVRDAFCLVEGVSVQAKRVLLVDDVFTTGSTMQACAEELKKASVTGVSGCTFARG